MLLELLTAAAMLIAANGGRSGVGMKFVLGWKLDVPKITM
jgi:hypothetical protein